jgi:hypothetical protein
MLRPTVSRPVLVSGPIWGSRPDFYYCQIVAGLLMRGALSVVHNCCWSSPAQSFSGPSPAGLMTTFYCLRFETPPTWRARSPYLYRPGTGWPSYTPRNWVPFSLLATTSRATVYWNPPTCGPISRIWDERTTFKNSVRTSQETFRLHNDQPVNAVWGNNRCLL